jgi:hypothetical protein
MIATATRSAQRQNEMSDKKSDITPSSGNVFADLGRDAADELQAKAMLMSKVALCSAMTSTSS